MFVRSTMTPTRILTVLSTVFLIAILVVDVPSTVAQDEKTENWLGTLDVKVAKLRLQLELKIDKDGNCVGEMISLDQGSARMELDRVVRSDATLEFDIKNIGAKFSGKMNDDQTVAAGEFFQGAAYDMEFKRIDSLKPDKHIQSWKGLLKAAGKEFDFQFRVFEDGEGKPFAKLDSFSESIMGIACGVKHEGDTITITVPATRAKFIGTLSDDRKTIDGNWIQSGGEFPLELTKIPIEATRSTSLKRPQTPKPPFDYDVDDFQVKVSELDSKYDADVELAGTLTSPRGEGPFPTVILISGSGPQDRDETIFEHKPFLVIADHLAKNGIAVIRFDDRGVAESKGDLAKATSADFANDVEALFLWAKKNQKVDAKKIVLMGHSEGGLIAPMVASRQKESAGVIMLAGPGVAGDQIILNQTREIAAVAGLPENVLDMQENMLKIVLEHLKSGAEFDDKLKDRLQAEFADVPEEQRKLFGLDDVAETTIARLNSPWMRYFVSYDPKQALSETDCPILSLIGERDLQVDKDLNFPAIEEAVKSGGNQDFVQMGLPELNHLFQRCETGSPNEYMKIEQTLDQSLLDELTQWLTKRMLD